MAINEQKAQTQLGKVIREKRKELGYSQESFADACDIHRTYMGSVERGERNISLKNILIIAAALNMKSSTLLELSKL